MSDDSLCPDCGATYETTDNYCRGCGMYLAALRAIEPVPLSTPVVVPRPRTGLPAPVTKLATAVAVGTALQIGVGLAGKYLAGQAMKQAVNVAVPKPKKGGKVSKAVEKRPSKDITAEDPMGGASAIAETLIVRRVWIRRP